MKLICWPFLAVPKVAHMKRQMSSQEWGKFAGSGTSDFHTIL
jgi:hypothetical protein